MTMAVAQVSRRRRAIRQQPLSPGALLATLVLTVAVAAGQERQRSVGQPGERKPTVLNADFAAKLADLELNWPADATISAAQEKDVRYARYDTARWQSIVLTARFAAVPFGARGAEDEGSEFTVGVSPGGYDAVYYRWETDDYWLQFQSTRQRIAIVVEPKSAAKRPALSAHEVEKRATELVRKLVRRGALLLSNSRMKLEPAACGYRVRFELYPEQSAAMRRDDTDRREASDLWLMALEVRTDGYSFVFDCFKGGVGPALPSKEKAWFKEANARRAATP